MLAFVTILSIIGNVLLGLFVSKKNPSSATNNLFLALNFAIACWSAANYFSIVNTDPLNVLLWIRLVMFFAVSISAAFLLLIVTFPYNHIPIRSWKLALYVVIMVLSALSAISPFVFTGIDNSGNSIQPIPGPLIPVFIISAIGSIIFGIFRLVKKYMSSNGLLKIQLRYVLLGTSVMFFLILATIFFPVIFLRDSYFVKFSPFYTLPFVAATAYSIVKHRFLDIRLVVARSVVYSLLVLILASFYTIVVFFVSRLFFNNTMVTSEQIMVYTVLALFVAFTFQPLKVVLEKLTDKIFFKSGYESNALLSSLTKIMTATLNLGELTKLTLHKLLQTIHISRGAFLILEGSNTPLHISEGFDGKLIYSLDNIRWLCAFKRLLIVEEENDELIKQRMKELDLSVVLPLYVEDRLHGTLILGEKESGEVYSNQDIQVLQIFGPEVSVAIQNAKAYEEIRKFNITLKEQIDIATGDLQTANQRLRELDKLKDDFVSVASHELRTPMTAIKSYLWMAIHHPDMKLSEKMIKYITRAYISTERLINLVNDMLNVSRIEAGRIEIRPSKFNIEDVVDDVILEIGIKAKEKNIKLSCVKERIPDIFADPEKVHQVLLNILGNALKFTPNGGSIKVSFFSDGKVVETSVKDSGVGIAKNDLSQLFQKFGRLDNSYVASATTGGTGLGLYICKSLVDLMKGKIWARSEGAGKGTTFTFSLPAATPAVVKHAKDYTKEVIGGAKTLETTDVTRILGTNATPKE